MLRLSGLDFEKEYVANLSKMPKGNVPVLQDGDKLIPDSSLIQRYLTETYGIDLYLIVNCQYKCGFFHR